MGSNCNKPTAPGQLRNWKWMIQLSAFTSILPLFLFGNLSCESFSMLNVASDTWERVSFNFCSEGFFSVYFLIQEGIRKKKEIAFTPSLASPQEIQQIYPSDNFISRSNELVYNCEFTGCFLPCVCSPITWELGVICSSNHTIQIKNIYLCSSHFYKSIYKMCLYDDWSSTQAKISCVPFHHFH